MGKKMSQEDLHFFGLKVVYKDLVDKGFEVLNVRREMDVNPQILARKEEVLYFIVVRTATFPEMGILLPEIAAKVSHHAMKHQAVCRFGSVGVANAKGDSDEEMGHPEMDGEYYINYKGLMPFPQ